MTPDAPIVAYPALLPDWGSPTLRVYPVYTVIAEKYHAMVQAPSLPEVINRLYILLWPATQVAMANSGATATWSPEHLNWI